MGSDIRNSMKTAALVLAFALGVSADGLGGHSHAHAPARRGRQEEAPLDAYAQPAYGEDLDTAASDVADPLAMLRSLRPHSLVTVRLMEVTMLMVRLSARSSISAQLMELEVWPSTASSAPTEPSSTRTTSSVIGGSTSTVLKLRIFTLSMMTSLLNVLKLMPLPLMLKLPTLLLLM